MPKITARVLCKEWSINVQHALYREDGTWYHLLQRFPGALFDARGYIVFETENDYRMCPGALFGRGKNWMNVPAGIATLPNYCRMR
jgi:5-methylcytosine-specific restriction enzyme A